MLYRATQEGQGKRRLEYLIAQGADVDTTDATGLTALYYAAFRGNEEDVRLLLESEAEVFPDHRVLGTPACIAALRGHAEAVKTLLQYSSNVDNSSNVLGSALHCAYYSGVPAIMNLATLATQPVEEREQITSDFPDDITFRLMTRPDPVIYVLLEGGAALDPVTEAEDSPTYL